MNKLKDHAQKEGLQYFLTYADNNAIEYFRKQGFTKQPTMPETRWKGYIKDYNGSTMMQCTIHQNIDYVNISQTIRGQKEVSTLEKLKFLVFNKQDSRNNDKEKVWGTQSQRL